MPLDDMLERRPQRHNVKVRNYLARKGHVVRSTALGEGVTTV